MHLRIHYRKLGRNNTILLVSQGFIFEEEQMFLETNMISAHLNPLKPFPRHHPFLKL